MKLKNLLCLAVIAMAMSCSVIRDHPKQVPPNSQGPYLLTLKIIKDETTIGSVRNSCMNILAFDAWNNVKESGNYAIVHLQYNYIPSGSLNRFLENLHGIRGLRVIEVKPILY